MARRSYCVVGYGSIGSRHARNLATLGCDDIRVVEPSQDRRDAAERDGYARVYSALPEALAETPDVVLVCAPTSSHLDVARQAFDAGADLFVEKPLATSVASACAFVDAFERSGRVGLVASNWRFHPAFRVMRSHLENGALGTVFSAEATFGSFLPGWHPDEDYRTGYSAKRGLGGGILLDAHEFDYLRWLMGPVAAAFGVTRRTGLLETETEDLALAVLRFRTGVVGNVQLDYLQRRYRRSFRFSGSDASLQWDVETGLVEILRDGEREVVFATPPTYELNEMYLAQTEHLLACLDRAETPTASLGDGLDVVRIIDAVRRSAASGSLEPVR